MYYAIVAYYEIKVQFQFERKKDVILKVKNTYRIYYLNRNSKQELQTSYSSDSAYEYHEYDEYSTCSPNMNFECANSNIKEIDHPYLSPNKVWIKNIGLTTYAHKTSLSENELLRSNINWVVKQYLSQFCMSNSFISRYLVFSASDKI